MMEKRMGSGWHYMYISTANHLLNY